MKKSRQNASDRHAQLTGLLKKRGYCSVVEMSQLLNVSPMTIRRDLHILHEKQIVELTYGGARWIALKRNEPDFDVRTREHQSQVRFVLAQSSALPRMLALQSASHAVYANHVEWSSVIRLAIGSSLQRSSSHAS